MLRPFFIILMAIYCHATTYAQNAPNPIPSATIIKQGIQAYDSGLYKQSIGLYQQIDRNDTNYVWAQYELGLTYYADSQFDKSIAACKTGLSVDAGQHYAPDLFTMYGNSLDASGHSEEALKIYDEGIRKFPAYSLLYLNKGGVYLGKTNYPEAEKIFQQGLLIDPYSYSSHFKLGLVALNQGKIVQAMLSFTTYLLLNPGGRYTSNCIKLLDNIARNKENIQPLWGTWTGASSENYQSVSEIIQSGIALDKEYKTLTHIDDPLIRQLQVLFEKIEYEKDSKDFWVQYYVPFFKDVFASGKFEPLVNQCFSTVNLPMIKEYLANNKKEIKDLTTKASAYFTTILTTRTLDLHARDTVTLRYQFTDGELQGRGRLSDNGKKLLGPWQFNYKAGNLKSEMVYDEKGIQGLARYYYFDGTLKSVQSYKDGKLDGETITYFTNGKLYWKSLYKNDLEEGEEITWFKSGNLHYKLTNSKGKLTGEKLTWFENGNLSMSEHYQADERQGETRSYFENGKLDYIVFYVKNKLDGPFKRYWKNGKLSIEGTYKNGEADGVWAYYHENGKLKSQQTYVKGKLEGDYQQSYANGNTYLSYKLVHGDIDGDATYNDEDGKLHFIDTYDKGKLIMVRYFDKTGKEISRAERKDNRLEYDMLAPDGTIDRHVIYNAKGNIEGEYRFFFPSGATKEIDRYVDGATNGECTTYFANGKKKYIFPFTDDKKNGYVKTFYSHGQIETEGWQMDGDYQGAWLSYDEQGNLSSNSWFVDNERHGYTSEYWPNGKLQYESKYYKGTLQETVQYDSTGKEFQRVSIPDGSGSYKLIYADGKTYSQCQYINGQMEGPRNFYFYDGKPLSTSFYHKGMEDSVYTIYWHSGKINQQGQYELGEKTGSWKLYTSDGKLIRDETYSRGQREGKSIDYYRNGKVLNIVEYSEDEKNGKYTMYSEDGTLQCQLNYLHDKLLSYTYPGKDGQLVADIPIIRQAGYVKTYFANGKPSFEMQYKDGVVNGPHKTYHPNGQLAESYTMDYGIREGVYEQYFDNGKLKARYNYAHDNFHGPYQLYSETGKIKEEGNYYNDSLHGDLKTYDEQGRLKETDTYYYGKLMMVK